jgi:hypothetical protein
VKLNNRVSGQSRVVFGADLRSLFSPNVLATPGNIETGGRESAANLYLCRQRASLLFYKVEVTSDFKIWDVLTTFRSTGPTTRFNLEVGGLPLATRFYRVSYDSQSR